MFSQNIHFVKQNGWSTHAEVAWPRVRPFVAVSKETSGKKSNRHSRPTRMKKKMKYSDLYRRNSETNIANYYG